jgi:hypothetical protein
VNTDKENRNIYGNLYEELKRRGYFHANAERKIEIWKEVTHEN